MRFDEAYREAQAAAYDTLQWLAATDARRDFTLLQLLGEKPVLDEAEALIGHALCLRTLALGLLTTGYLRAALLVACGAVRAVYGFGQAGIESMVYEMTGRVLLALGEVAAAKDMCASAEEFDHKQTTNHPLHMMKLRELGFDRPPCSMRVAARNT